MRLLHICFIFTLILTLYACDEDRVDIRTIDELTVEAFLVAGEPLDSVRFGKIIPLDSTQITSIPENLTPMVSLGNGESYELIYSGVDGIYGNDNLIIEEETSYRLEVMYNDKMVSAETYIPSAPENLTLSASEIDRTEIKDFADILNQEFPDPIDMSWEGNPGAFYYTVIKNVEDDPELIFQLFADADEAPSFFDVSTEPSTAVDYTIIPRDISHFGLHEIIVYRVNPEYVTLYDSNTSGAGALNEIVTNIENGFGIFTGVSSARATLKVNKR